MIKCFDYLNLALCSFATIVFFACSFNPMACRMKFQTTTHTKTYRAK
jgi:hypothetical protein